MRPWGLLFLTLLPASFSSYQPPNQAQGFALDGLRGRGSSLLLGQGLAAFKGDRSRQPLPIACDEERG